MPTCPLVKGYRSSAAAHRRAKRTNSNLRGDEGITLLVKRWPLNSRAHPSSKMGEESAGLAAALVLQSGE